MTTEVAVRERPILFSGPMIKAILSGAKSQTRRVVKPQPPAYINELHGRELSKRAPYRLENDEGVFCGHGFQDDNGVFYRCPCGQPGDRLWVRETFEVLDGKGIEKCIRYVADGEEQYVEDTRPAASILDMKERKWVSIHMPRWASRITLEVTAVRVERLGSISDDDALADGGWTYSTCPFHKSPVKSFEQLWDSINGDKFPWKANPFVWVVEFKKL